MRRKGCPAVGLCVFVCLSNAADRDKVITKRAQWMGRPLEVALAAPGSGWASTARGGNSSPGPCTSRTGAADAPCSGRKHPGRRVSLKAAEEGGGGQEVDVEDEEGEETAGLNQEPNELQRQQQI